MLGYCDTVDWVYPVNGWCGITESIVVVVVVCVCVRGRQDTAAAGLSSHLPTDPTTITTDTNYIPQTVPYTLINNNDL